MNLDKATIEQFLREIGKQSRQSGKLYLLGGAALVHAGIRPGVTQDIDLKVEGNMDQVIRRISQQRNLFVEFVEPAAFIPLPRGYQFRNIFVGQYGKIQVQYFDFITIAISKIMRSQARDVSDVAHLVQQGIIEKQELDDAVQEVSQRMGFGPYSHLDARRFLANYQAIKSRF